MQKDWSQYIYIYIYEEEIKIILKQDNDPDRLISNLVTSVYLSISKNLSKNNNHRIDQLKIVKWRIRIVIFEVNNL